MTAIIVFASSLLLAVLLLFLKTLEIKNQRQSFPLRLINKLDAKSERLVAFLKFKCLQFIQSIRYIVLVETKKMAKDWLRRIQDRILDEYRMRHNMIMGHKEIVGNGSASFYLRKITEDKSRGRKGKIEDSLPE